MLLFIRAVKSQFRRRRNTRRPTRFVDGASSVRPIMPFFPALYHWPPGAPSHQLQTHGTAQRGNDCLRQSTVVVAAAAGHSDDSMQSESAHTPLALTRCWFVVRQIDNRSKVLKLG